MPVKPMLAIHGSSVYADVVEGAGLRMLELCSEDEEDIARVPWALLRSLAVTGLLHAQVLEK